MSHTANNSKIRFAAEIKNAGSECYFGSERRRAYGYSLGLFFTTDHEDTRTLYVLPYEFVAPPFVDNDNFDVLLGMDILSQGRLLFEPSGEFSFAFEF